MLRPLHVHDKAMQQTAVGVVGRVALALVGARMTPTTHASIADRDDIEVGLNREVATRPAASPSVSHAQVSGSSSSAAP
jgi:hypothetical protein